MESSEDDAGNATSASCRASAREKDIGQAENVEPTHDTQHEPPEASVWSRTRTMSEDNFDGDSIPSPSPQDVNTSTEAILDMIDEFVDGPGAPKRLPLRTAASPALNAILEPVELLETEPKQQTHHKAEQPRTLPAASIDDREMINESASEKLVECAPHIEDSICASTSSNVNSPQTSSDSVDKTETLSDQQTDYNSAVISAEPESLAVQAVSDSPSSSIQTVQNISNISECEQSEQLERTIKCVTSSDHRDSVTVERAESTSSECSVNEIKGFPVEPSSRSPLKRRLVRPAASDRRPDSTVSSTVDSNIHPTHLTSCDVVMKDVSSSSDAVPNQHGKVKPEEISKVSEISICKAETSSAPKKIRLVRPKVTAVLSNSVKTPEAFTPSRKQCQSTSTDDNASPIFPIEPATSQAGTCKSQEHTESLHSVKYVKDNVSIQVQETITHAEMSKTKENVISIESATPSVSTILPSQSTTIQSKELELSDAQEAPSEVLSIAIEPIKVQSKMEITDIQPKKLELKTSDMPVISNSEEIIQPTESVQIQLKAESINLEVSQDLESRKPVNKITDVPLIEQSEDQSTRLLASHGQSEESVIQSQSEQSKPKQIENRPKPTESQPNVQKSTDILLNELEKPSKSRSKGQKPIENHSKVVASTFVDTFPIKKTVEELEIEIKPKIFDPTQDQVKQVEQNKVQSIDEESEKSSKVPDSTENQPKGMGTAENQLEVQKPTESQPIVLAQEKNESVEIAKCLLNTLTNCQTETQEPAEEVKTVGESKQLTETQKPVERNSEAIASAVVMKLAGSALKVCEPAEVKPAESESTELLNLAKSESKALLSTKVLKPAESEPNVSQPTELIKPADIEPKACKPAEVKLTESQPKAYKPAEVKPAESDPKAHEPTELLKLAKSESKSLLSTKVLKPAESEPKVQEPEEVLKAPKVEPSEVLKSKVSPAESESEALKPKEVMELAANELKSLSPTKVMKPAESEPEVLESVEILKPGESESKVLHSAKAKKPTESQSKALEPAEVIKPTEIDPKVCEPAEILKPADCESEALLSTKVIKPVENKPADVNKPAECVSAPEPAKEVEPVESESKKLKPESSHQNERLEPVFMTKVPKVEKTHSAELKGTDAQLLNQIQSQPEQSYSALTQSKDLKLEIAQMEQTKEKHNKLKKTNIYSKKIEPLEFDSETEELKEKESLEVSKESGKVGVVEPLPMEVECESRQQQPLEAKSNALDEERKLPPIKLTLTKVSKADKKSNDSEAESVCKNTVVFSHQDKQVSASNTEMTYNCDSSSKSDDVLVDHKKVRPIRLNLSNTEHNSTFQSSAQKSNVVEEKPDSTKQVPKLTIKLGNKPVEEMKSPIPKLTIKPIRPPIDQMPERSFENNQQIPSVTKLNIKPIVKPLEENDTPVSSDDQAINKEKIPSITKLNIKPIHKSAEKINDMHRKSSSSEISESEYSENDETSTSDQTSASDQGPSDIVPKVTIKLGKPGTESEGKFYTQKNIPKLTIRGLQQNEYDEKDAKLKLVISQSEDKPMEKVPKLTIKTITKSEGQPLSPKLTIKPIKAPEIDIEIPSFKITTEEFGTSSDIKENMQVPKITIKAVTKTDSETHTKTPKKSTLICDSPDHIPVVTKLNIKPILKPMENAESSEELVDKVPVVSKLNIKPIIKPKDNEVDSSVVDVPKITKLNIKPLRNPEESSSDGQDCDENIVDMGDKSIPVVTKLNIKPIFKPEEDDGVKYSENQSSETGTSSDDNSDHIPVVTKLNIKPIVKPSEMEEVMKPIPNDQNIPVVTKLNIKPLVKPEENMFPSSPKRECLRSPGGSGNSKSKLNIKPIVKHEDTSENKHDDNLDKSTKNPPLVMKINMKNVCDSISDQKFNSCADGTKSPRQPMSPKVKKSTLTPDRDNPKTSVELRKNIGLSPDSSNITFTMSHESNTHLNFLLENNDLSCSKELKSLPVEVKQVPDKTSNNKNAVQINEVLEKKPDLVGSPLSPGLSKQKKSLQNCTLLKQLLSNTKDDSEKSREMSVSNCLPNSEKTDSSLTNFNATTSVKTLVDEIRKNYSDLTAEFGRRSPISESSNDLSHLNKSLKTRTIQEIRKDANESVTKPLEIVTDKLSNQSSGQDSPRIILKINKTDHGPSSKIITEECHKPKDSPPQNHIENTHDTTPMKQSPKKYVNSKKKLAADEAVSLTIGKRLRSSRVVETPDKPPTGVRRNATKRPSISETSPTPKQETEMSVFESKRLKLEQLLSVNKGLTITPVAHYTQTLPSKPRMEMKQVVRKNHSLLNNDNSKNGNSKLHNILSNLQAKQMQSLQRSEAANKDKDPIILPDAESNTSTGSSDVVVEISRIENCHPDVQEMIISENSDFRDLSTPDEVSQDPLEVDTSKVVEEVIEPVSIKAVEVTPTPRKRGRPRKIPLSDTKPAKPTPPALPVSALDERPQRSLRLMRDRPVVTVKPRGGRGRGRGGRRAASPVAAPRPPSDDDSTETVIVIETLDEDEPQRPVTPVRPPTPEDPTSSRIKLPRMTEALDKSSASMSMTPLSSRRRSSTDMKLFGEPSVVIESQLKLEQYMKSPEVKGTRGRGRGRGTPRGRTPRGRGRGRGGGKGATYMKETMGIYGRVCGPATTTVELFEEETCMMDDNATPKPSHLLDEDSQSSVKSSTNDSSNKMKKSKFADLFDSNKVWAASDVKEYTWPPPDVPDVEHQVMMIQEQVAMFLGVKSFKRRYSELKRRAVIGEEKNYCLQKGIVTEALCDLGITAVDASDVLDIMLSDYPHKYEEYRSYQRQKQLTESLEQVDAKLDEKACKVEIKSEKTSDKPEPPKVDPEKTRQDMAAAAIASAAEWNAMANVWRRGACADLQSNTIHRRRPPPTSAPIQCRPPHGFYPHAVLPGQYQHTYVQYTPEQLRYFPLNTALAAPPAPPSPIESSSESEGSWEDSSTSSDDSHVHHHSAKRKKLTKVKRSSQHDKDKDDSRGMPAEEVVDLCRVCKLRLEANRKYTHDRFLVCSHCNAKLHPSCTELSLDTIRKCREYAWQCGECKRCGACGQQGQQGQHKMMFCELCDRGYHTHCVSPPPSTGRWHCAECSVCKSCGAREPAGLPGAPGIPGPSGTPGPGTPGTSGASGTPGAEWHHQTKRGPGGHKVYSHSLCTPCARAYRIGRYCPLCDRSFIGPKGTMQLVICKLCDRQLHQECVRATVSSLNVLDYRCAECRRGGITSRAGAVRAAPRTIATLFMAKRRFNKYAHKQYMQRRQRPPSDPEASDPLDADSSRTDFGD